ncbi:MAG: HAD family phosphatase [Ruminococcaceae bacterium]|nr:HAD family phosphatase [Oscillospiraceae bacterium]
MIRGILFDFNGTLFFDSEKHIAAFKEFFGRRGLCDYTSSFLADATFGRTNSVIFRDLYRSDATDEDIERYSEEKESLYHEECIKDPKSFCLAPGAYEMLDHLKENNIPFNMATGTGEKNVSFYFEHLDIGRWFDHKLIVSDNGTLPGKPAPDFFIEAARRIGLEPEECIVFEDSVSGILSANAAKAGAVVAVLSMKGKSPLTEETRVDAIVEDFRGYKDILRKFGI